MLLARVRLFRTCIQDMLLFSRVLLLGVCAFFFVMPLMGLRVFDGFSNLDADPLKGGVGASST